VSTPKTTSVAALLASVIVTSVAPFYVSRSLPTRRGERTIL
jgi:hypothetical protein